MYAVNGILFNHESERRGETFVTRKITLAAANIAAGRQEKLYLGNLNAKRDWGYARDYVECMWLMLQHDTPEDFVIATGETRTVREFTKAAFAHAGIRLRFEGGGLEEEGIDEATRESTRPQGASWWRCRRNSSARRRWICCWATRRRPGRSWAGIPGRPPSTSWSESWWSTTWSW